MLEAFGRCLQRERRLAPLTVTGTVGVVGRVLTAPAGLPLSALTVQHVHQLVASEASRLSIGATRTSVSALRVFLQFLFATGRTPVDLGGDGPLCRRGPAA